MRYTVECGAFVTFFQCDKVVVHASNDEDAKEKAIEKFIKNYNDIGGDLDELWGHWITTRSYFLSE